MAGKQAKFIRNYVSHLDLKDPRKPPKWHYWRHGRKRMQAAARSALWQYRAVKGWEKGCYDSTSRQSGPGMMRAMQGSDTATDAALWAVARVRAEEIIQKMKDNGQLDDDKFPDLSQVEVPGSDEAIAKAALTEAVTIALGPVDRKSKLAALKMVLDFTKQKPAQKVDAKINSVEDWLAAINSDDGAA